MIAGARSALWYRECDAGPDARDYFRAFPGREAGLPECLFASDLHGRRGRYEKLLAAVAAERPAAVFLGGDLLPGIAAIAANYSVPGDFLDGWLLPRLEALRDRMGAEYPPIFVILGNDDPRSEEAAVEDADGRGLWSYAHRRRLGFGDRAVFGYAHVPPSPFRLKDWERYDVSRFVDPGCVSPEDGVRTVPADSRAIRHGTIAGDLEALAGEAEVGRDIFLFHTPAYRTKLDRAALDGRMVDHAPVDVHVGSIAVRRFIEGRQPCVTLHGHVHEAARLTGDWRESLGRTWMLGAAHDGPELALVRFDPDCPEAATRELV